MYSPAKVHPFFRVRPIIMQLDLQSVEKVPFSTFAWALVPKMLEIVLPRLGMTWGFSKIYSYLFPASPGVQLQEMTVVSTFSVQLGQIRLQSPIGSEKKRSGIVTQLDRKRTRRIPSTGPLEKQEKTALNRSWTNLHVILRGRRPISNIFGAKAY